MAGLGPGPCTAPVLSTQVPVKRRWLRLHVGAFNFAEKTTSCPAPASREGQRLAKQAARGQVFEAREAVTQQKVLVS